MPNISGRMDNLRAAILRPQLRAARGAARGAGTERYRAVEAGLRGTPGLTLIARPAAEGFVGSSFQFLLLDWPDAAVGARGRALRRAGGGAEMVRRAASRWASPRAIATGARRRAPTDARAPTGCSRASSTCACR